MNDDPKSPLSKDLRVCPECGTPLEPYAEVDIGVGTLQGGPWGCPACHWIETDPALAETALPDIDLAIADDDGDEL